MYTSFFSNGGTDTSEEFTYQTLGTEQAAAGRSLVYADHNPVAATVVMIVHDNVFTDWQGSHGLQALGEKNQEDEQPPPPAARQQHQQHQQHQGSGISASEPHA